MPLETSGATWPGVAMADGTNLFEIDQSHRCALTFLARRTTTHSDQSVPRQILSLLGDFAQEGWQLSVQDMLSGSTTVPVAYDMAAFGDVDVAGIFEAPSIGVALDGIDRFESAGWGRLFSTEWIVGVREFGPVGVPNPNATAGFVALWEWNDAWCRSSSAERDLYDAECDVAFESDLAAGINISGRHRSDLASRWHHFAVWDAPSFASVTTAMTEHEAASDFKFTLSRHYLGRRMPLSTILEVNQ